ncbi:MAG: Rha family transcriptional regulator [Desulfobacterales bacterium]|nr:Rha family transcriptional regulator [Desulfobacterales bacterium]
MSKNQNVIEPVNFVSVENGQPVTTSKIIADKFEKEHKDVLKIIKNLECSRKFSQRNFAPASYLDHQNKARPMYKLTRDGFVFLVTGFTGAKAARVKEAYIAAFNEMERRLTERPEQPQPAPESVEFADLKKRVTHLTNVVMQLENIVKSNLPAKKSKGNPDSKTGIGRGSEVFRIGDRLPEGMIVVGCLVESEDMPGRPLVLR